MQGLLLVYSHAHDCGALGSFAKRHNVTTQRSRHRTNSPRSGVVLVDSPEKTLMETAVQMGQLALCAIERPNFSLLGWAMETEAENLLTGEVIPDTRTDEQKRLLDFVRTAGHNGWHDDYAKMRVPPLLKQLQESGLELDVICGVMLARGARASSIEKLPMLAKKA